MKDLNRQQSEEILQSWGEKGENWKAHSHLVARVAEILASALVACGYSLQEEYIFGAALLHDLGRSKTHGEGHGWEGYQILSQMGYDHYGRFCLTHWLKGRTLEEAIEDCQELSKEELEKIYRQTHPEELSLEDKIVILADGMVLGNRVASLEERCQEWEKRYGDSPWLARNRAIFTRLQSEMEGYLGQKLEKLLQKKLPSLEKKEVPSTEPLVQKTFTLTHLDEQGTARMVDISQKKTSVRTATAVGIIKMKGETLQLARENRGAKGDAFQVSRIAAIMAAKNTAQLIPLCHPLPLTSVSVDFAILDDQRIEITSTAKTTYGTGVEMEALTAVSLAALTLYDMLKAVDKTMEIGSIHLVKKTGGKSGDFVYGEKT